MEELETDGAEYLKGMGFDYKQIAHKYVILLKLMQIKKPYEKCEFINEFFITNALISSIQTEKNIDKGKAGKNNAFNEFRSLLFYNLKYRPVFQQTLELAIKAFFSGCEISRIR